jgi:hypothetical protein
MPEPIIDPNAPAILPTEGVEIPPRVETPAAEVPVVETPDEEVVEPFRKFETEEEYNEWVAEERTKLQPAPIETPSSEEPTIFAPGWQPKDWNDFATQLLKNPNAVKMLQEKLVPETRKAIEDLTNKERQELENINVGFDREYQNLSKKGLLPAMTTEEGARINQEISMVGATFGQTNLTKSYELWKKLPKSEGGGLEYTPPAKERLNAQKAAAGKVGSSQGGSPGAVGVPKKYNDLHLRSLDDQVEDALKQ